MAKKRNKISVPKRLAGVKIPKAVRRGLKGLAASQSGKAVIAEALVAAGAALVAAEAQPDSKARRAIREKAPAAKGAARKAAGGVTATALESRAALGVAFEEATRMFTDTLRRRSSPATSSPASIAEEPAGATH